MISPRLFDVSWHAPITLAMGTKQAMRCCSLMHSIIFC